MRLEFGRYDGPGLGASLNVTFRRKQRVSRIDRTAGQSQVLGHGARRGNAVARLQQPPAYGIAEPVVDLTIEGRIRREIRGRHDRGAFGGHGRPFLEAPRADHSTASGNHGLMPMSDHGLSRRVMSALK
jgi:hypothetical protein